MRTSKTNEAYQSLMDLGYTLYVTTSNKNRGKLHLLKDGVRLHTVPFSTNGRGTTRVLETLPTSYRLSHPGRAMNACLEWIEGFHFEQATVAADPFVEKYNQTIEKFAPVAFKKVKDTSQQNPSLTFEQLFRIWSVEIQYLMKTENRQWKMS